MSKSKKTFYPLFRNNEGTCCIPVKVEATDAWPCILHCRDSEQEVARYYLKVTEPLENTHEYAYKPVGIIVTELPFEHN